MSVLAVHKPYKVYNSKYAVYMYMYIAGDQAKHVISWYYGVKHDEQMSV